MAPQIPKKFGQSLRCFKLMEIFGVIEKDKEPKCVGNYFRCRVNKFYNKKTGEISIKVSYKRLRKRSCKGECATTTTRTKYDFFEEDIGEDLETLILPKEPKDGAIYELVFCVLNANGETGYIDEWEWRLMEVSS